ncbi:hypothetical protein HAX54_008980 [Datura stramonium]|uniref:KIB1-4 beta-propeller domain-containing protein n=1 Tax=Datura stramonium TaxID=4076 RepID=A0ABS8RVU3_DATST|nr:hypothetical protein [Datura stramonium]
MANWAALPVDLLVQTANHVKVIEDFIALRAVCTSWRAAVAKSNFDVFSPQVPLLMFGGPSMSQPIVNSRFLVWLEGTFHRPKRFCLVKIAGALLIISRISNGVRGSRPNFRFKVSELDVIRGELNEISNLGDSAIFLSRDGASSINCFRFPGVKPNHIYFTDDSCNKYKCLVSERYMRAYDIEDQKIESLYPGLSSFHPLTWVTPSF